MLKNIKQYIKRKIIRIEKQKVLIPILEGHFLEGRSALITGGNSGIGYEIARSFLRNGANVIITGRNIDKLNKAKEMLTKECKNSQKVEIGVLDISNVNTIKVQFEKIVSSFNGKIDIFVNNAGVNGGKYFPLTSEEEYDLIMDTNLKGMYFFSQEIVKYMLNNKIEGNILNVTSSSSLRPAISPYIISKWGENALTRGMAKKYLKYGIIVNAIAHGSTLTPMLNTNNLNMNLDYSPSKRYAAPEEIGNLATVLVSSMGKMVVGDTLYATGGAGILTYDDMGY